MARLAERVTQAFALHQQAAAMAHAAARLLRTYPPVSAAADHLTEERALIAQLRSAAAKLAPGWLDAPLDVLAATTPLGGSTLPTFVRVGLAHPLDDATFPVMVPLLGAGHVAVDADARDPRVAGLLRALVLRLLAAAPARSVSFRIVDSAEVGGVFAAFRTTPAIPVATDEQELRSLLSEAETWIANRPADPGGPILLLIIASLPELTDGRDLDRISALAKAGPAGRLHILAAGWPPPPLTAETTQRPLPYCTQITLRNPHAWVGDPPGASFTADGSGPGRLSAPVYLDHDPPSDLVRRVCEELASATEDRSAGAEDDPPVPHEPAHAAWREYLTAAQRLAVVRSQATAVVAEHDAIRTAALKRLTAVQARLTGQVARLGNATASAGLPPMPIGPDQTLVDSEWASLAQASAPPVAASTALRNADALLDAADAALGDAIAHPAGPTSGSAMSPALVFGLAGVMIFLVLLAGVVGLLLLSD